MIPRTCAIKQEEEEDDEDKEEDEEQQPKEEKTALQIQQQQQLQQQQQQQQLQQQQQWQWQFRYQQLQQQHLQQQQQLRYQQQQQLMMMGMGTGIVNSFGGIGGMGIFPTSQMIGIMGMHMNPSMGTTITNNINANQQHQLQSYQHHDDPVGRLFSSFGNVLQHLPDLLVRILPYIADRTVFNSIAFCNRDTYIKSKIILPPWPMNYKLGMNHKVANQSCCPSWSPSGTRVACTYHLSIEVHDQRHGPYRINENINRNDLTNITDLKFSPDGSFLVSAGDDCIVTILDNNVAENYEQLQEWNMKEDFLIDDNDECEYDFMIDVSPDSKYIIVATEMFNRVVLKDVEKRGKTIRSLTPQVVVQCINKITFSHDGRAVFVCGWEKDDEVIRLWRPYLDDADEDSLTTLLKQDGCYNRTNKNVHTHNGTMIAVHNMYNTEGWLLSIRNNHNYITQKLDFPESFISRRGIRGNMSLLHFTPDDKYIVYSTSEGLKYWSITEGIFTDVGKKSYNNGKNVPNLRLANYSPNNRQLIVADTTNKDNYYITSFFCNTAPNDIVVVDDIMTEFYNPYKNSL